MLVKSLSNSNTYDEVDKRNRALSEFRAKYLMSHAQRAKKTFSGEMLDDSEEDQMVKRNKALSNFKANYLMKMKAANAKRTFSDEDEKK